METSQVKDAWIEFFFFIIIIIQINVTVSTLAKDLSILDVLCYVISWNCRLFHVYCFKYIHFMYIVWKSAMPCVIMPYGHVKVFLLIFCWWKYSKHTRGEWNCLRWWMLTLMIVYVDDCLRLWLFTLMIVTSSCEDLFFWFKDYFFIHIQCV